MCIRKRKLKIVKATYTWRTWDVLTADGFVKRTIYTKKPANWYSYVVVRNKDACKTYLNGELI